MIKKCEECGKAINVRPSDLRRGRGRLCSHACCARKTTRLRRSQSGDKNPNWKGGNYGTKAYRKEMLRKYREKYPEKHFAHESVKSAVRSGVLKRGLCVICSDKKTHGHHEDYSKPLDVVWLCRKHHIGRHKELRDMSQARPA